MIEYFDFYDRAWVLLSAIRTRLFKLYQSMKCTLFSNKTNVTFYQLFKLTECKQNTIERDSTILELTAVLLKLPLAFFTHFQFQMNSAIQIQGF